MRHHPENVFPRFMNLSIDGQPFLGLCTFGLYDSMAEKAVSKNSVNIYTTPIKNATSATSIARFVVFWLV